MKGPVVLFGEGKADGKFLKDYVKYHFGIEDIEYVDVKGKDSIHLGKNYFLQNTDQGGINLLIFDADSDFQAAMNNINEQKDKTGIEFEVFLFPNNSDTGALEELLKRMTIEEHQGIFECFDVLDKCLTSKNNNYEVPDLKIQIYSYLSFQKLEAKEPVRDYTLSCWNLDAEYGNPLKEFLKNYLT
ncbi:hypothetical protein OGH69_06020 [Flavobacterium sp. MFBS3-15]|uniref:DUF3226 domain-containing protein n=1 Tax=Flavobacterium sp. MFBS3-15 TaxID=2989816 RepID=UPI002235B079|nr:DUF3226 domain-containing protein [Flavobacterium sp. MFBS3-15]MCW4468511.1 hypothetical protein [Flavobacterium sp. MFBS3-15]